MKHFACFGFCVTDVSSTSPSSSSENVFFNSNERLIYCTCPLQRLNNHFHLQVRLSLNCSSPLWSLTPEKNAEEDAEKGLGLDRRKILSKLVIETFRAWKVGSLAERLLY